MFSFKEMAKAAVFKGRVYEPLKLEQVTHAPYDEEDNVEPEKKDELKRIKPLNEVALKKRINWVKAFVKNGLDPMLSFPDKKEKVVRYVMEVTSCPHDHAHKFVADNEQEIFW